MGGIIGIYDCLGDGASTHLPPLERNSPLETTTPQPPPPQEDNVAAAAGGGAADGVDRREKIQ